MNQQFKYPIHPDEILRATFNSEQEDRSKGWTPTDVDYSNGVATFNGLTSKINIGKQGNVGTSDFTIVVRVKFAGTQDAYDFLYGNQNSSAVGIRLDSGASGKVLRLIIDDPGGGFYKDVETSDITDGKYHVVVFSADRDGYLRSYVDGNADGAPENISGIQGSYDTENDFLICADPRNGNPRFACDLDYLCVFRGVAFSAEDAKAWYEGRMFSELPKSVNGSKGTVLDINCSRRWLSGTTLHDASGNDNNGTLVNMDSSNLTKDAFGRAGKAMSFNGVDNWIQADSAALDPTFTVEGWFKPLHALRTAIVSFHNDLNENKNLLFWSAASANSRICPWDHSGYHCSVSTFNVGTWHHFVWIVQADGSAELFVDGVSEVTYVCNILTGHDRFSIGQEWDGDNPTDLFNGVISNVKVLNYALGPAQIKAMWRQLQNKGFGR